jgi:hypothetical protein
MFVRTEKIDPKDYPFNKFHDDQKHLDTDESRHLIKPVVHIIDQDLKGQEHQFCDKEQLCPLGKFRRPKILVESERRGFATVLEMMEANKKAEEDKKQKEIDELKEMVKALMEKLK